MKATYDKDVDVLLIKLNNSRPKYGEDIGEGIIVHFDKNKSPVEIEILKAKKYSVNWLEQALELKNKLSLYCLHTIMILLRWKQHGQRKEDKMWLLRVFNR